MGANEVQRIIEDLGEYLPQMTEWRRHIHAHPETAFEEVDTARYVAERLRSTMEASPYRLDSQRIPVTLSIGVTVHRRGKTLRQLLDEADRRAYRAKAGGRNRVVAEDLPVAG